MSRHERGFALIAVLVALAAASALVVTLGQVARSGAHMIGGATVEAQRMAELEAAVVTAVERTLDADPTRRWTASGELRRIELGQASVVVSLGDPGGLIDLNRSAPALIRALLALHVDDREAAAITDAIVARRRPEPPPLVAVQSLVSDQKLAARPPASPSRGTGFHHASQLREIDGMTPEIYGLVADSFTVHNGDGRININTAPPDVVGALDAVGGKSFIAARRRRGASAPADYAWLVKSASPPVYLITACAEPLSAEGGCLRTTVLVSLTSERLFHYLDWDSAAAPHRAQPAARALVLSVPALDD